MLIYFVSCIYGYCIFYNKKNRFMIFLWFFFFLVYFIFDKRGRYNFRELFKEDFLEFKFIFLYYIDFC